MLHHLMVGTWTPPGAIFTLAFDDEALTLVLTKKTSINQDEPISWMTFDVSDRIRSLKTIQLNKAIKHAKRNIYGASMKTFSSYAVKSPNEIAHHVSHQIGGHRMYGLQHTGSEAFLIQSQPKPAVQKPRLERSSFWQQRSHRTTSMATPFTSMLVMGMSSPSMSTVIWSPTSRTMSTVLNLQSTEWFSIRRRHTFIRRICGATRSGRTEKIVRRVILPWWAASTLLPLAIIPDGWRYILPERICMS